MRRRGPNTIRRGEAGVESNHTSRGRPLPAQNHKEVETREREREAACAPLGEQALSLAACFCFITGLVVEYGISDRLYPKSRP